MSKIMVSESYLTPSLSGGEPLRLSFSTEATSIQGSEVRLPWSDVSSLCSFLQDQAVSTTDQRLEQYKLGAPATNVPFCTLLSVWSRLK
jgi:hypothetical protein